MADVQAEYAARQKRVADAVQLIEPDRIPIAPVIQAFPVYYLNKWTIQDIMEDPRKGAECYDHFYENFKPDLGWDPILFFPTNYMERSGITWFRWPGKHYENPNIMYQYIEGEYMKGDEYAEAIHDVTKFMMNKWLPRSFSNLSGLAKVDFRNTMWFGHMGAFATFSDPEVISSFEALIDTGKMLSEWFGYLGEYRQRMKDHFGIPLLYAGFAYAPFDMIGDSMRGTLDILTDMYDRPDDLLKFIDVVTEFAIKDTIASCSGAESPYVWYWLHKGVDEFMSDENFKKFYWPSLRRCLTEVAEAGLTPVVYVEGKYHSRLEYLTEVPAKKVIYNFEYIDMAKAKKVLGGHSCIMGNVPSYTLMFGTPEETTECVKKLIDTCAPGGGYIVDSATMIDECKPENMEAMFEAVYKYGVR